MLHINFVYIRREKGNLNDTAVRFKLLFDDTDDQSAVRLLFHLNILDKKNTEIFELSNFPEDKTDYQKSKTIFMIKLALQQGKTIVLISTGISMSNLRVVNSINEYLHIDCR
ncbi:MAG TPA: hypothetical protein VIL29_00110 [Pseudothermotoga sp.]